MCLSGLRCMCPTIAHLWSAWGYLGRLKLAVHLSFFTDDYGSAAESRIARSKQTKLIWAKQSIKSNVTQTLLFISSAVQASQAYMLGWRDGCSEDSGSHQSVNQSCVDGAGCCWQVESVKSLDNYPPSYNLQSIKGGGGHKWVQNTLSMQN